MSFQPPLSGKEQDETEEFRPKFDANGLIAAVAQDADTGDVLMLAWNHKKEILKKEHSYTKKIKAKWIIPMPHINIIN